jgi:hypothetical protein
MKPAMRNIAYKKTITRNVYGDFVIGASTALPCHFRYITAVESTLGSEAVRSDAMAWFEADSGIVKNDILEIDDEGWRVERVTKARRLRDTTVLFLKVDLLRHGMIS